MEQARSTLGPKAIRRRFVSPPFGPWVSGLRSSPLKLSSQAPLNTVVTPCQAARNSYTKRKVCTPRCTVFVILLYLGIKHPSNLAVSSIGLAHQAGDVSRPVNRHSGSALPTKTKKNRVVGTYRKGAPSCLSLASRRHDCSRLNYQHGIA